MDLMKIRQQARLADHTLLIPYLVYLSAMELLGHVQFQLHLGIAKLISKVFDSQFLGFPV